MATTGTGKHGETAICGLATIKTISVAGDGTTSESLRNCRLDSSTQTLQTIEYEHHEIHAGSHFYVADSSTINEATTDAVDYLLVVPNTTKWPHVVFNVDGVAVTSVFLYEDCLQETSDGWTQLNVFNNNRNSSADATMEVWKYAGSSIPSSDFGDVIYSYASGATSMRSNTPMEARKDRELILCQGVKYVLRVLSGTASNLCNVLIYWYEHTDKS